MHKTTGAVNRKQEVQKMHLIPEKGIKRKSKFRKKFGKQGKITGAVGKTHTLKM
jgi:hypothetical protein